MLTIALEKKNKRINFILHPLKK